MVITAERYRFLDMARGAAMLFVVWGHALGGGALRQVLYAFHVPLFFLLSGLLFSPGTGGWGRFLGKRARRILLPYLAFGLVSILVFALLGRTAAAAVDAPDNIGEYGIFPNLLGLLYGNNKTGLMKWNLPLWFLPCLFVMENLFYPLDALARRCPRRSAVLWPALALFLGLSRLLTRRFGGGLCLPLGLETAINLFPFFILGGILRPALPAMGASTGLWRGALAAAGAALLGLCVLLALGNDAVIYTADEYGAPALFYAAALCGAGGVVLLCAGAGRWAPLEYLGKRSLGVLCMHKFPLLLCRVALPLTAGAMAAGSVWVTLAVSLAACGLCLAADRIIRRRLPFFYGETYPKRTDTR